MNNFSCTVNATVAGVLVTQIPGQQQLRYGPLTFHVLSPCTRGCTLISVCFITVSWRQVVIWFQPDHFLVANPINVYVLYPTRFIASSSPTSREILIYGTCLPYQNVKLTTDIHSFHILSDLMYITDFMQLLSANFTVNTCNWCEPLPGKGIFDQSTGCYMYMWFSMRRVNSQYINW